MKNPHCGPDRVAVRLRAHQANPDASVPGELIVSVEMSWAVIGCHQQVEVTITIEIAVGQTAADLRLAESVTDLRRYVVKRSLPAIQEKLRRLRITHIADVPHCIVDVPIHHREIERTIQIGIKKHAPEPQLILRRQPDSALRG